MFTVISPVAVICLAAGYKPSMVQPNQLQHWESQTVIDLIQYYTIDHFYRLGLCGAGSKRTPASIQV